MGRWLAMLATLPMTGCFNGLLLTPTYVNCPVEETEITCARRWLCRNKVALIDVEGTILNARSSGLLGSGENPVSLFRERLDAAADDPRVKAVVLRINSPGGGVTASDMMYQDLVRFRRETHKPVVACMLWYAAEDCRRNASVSWPTAGSTPASTPRNSAWSMRWGTWRMPLMRHWPWPASRMPRS